MKALFVYTDQIADVCLQVLKQSERIEYAEHFYDVYTTGKRVLEVVDANGTTYHITVEAL